MGYAHLTLGILLLDISLISQLITRGNNVMDVEKKFFDHNLFKTIRLAFLIHNWIIFHRKSKKYNLKKFSQIVAQ